MQNNNNKTNISSVVWIIGFGFTLGILLTDAAKNNLDISFWKQIEYVLTTLALWPILLGMWVAGK